MGGQSSGNTPLIVEAPTAISLLHVCMVYYAVGVYHVLPFPASGPQWHTTIDSSTPLFLLDWLLSFRLPVSNEEIAFQ